MNFDLNLAINIAGFIAFISGGFLYAKSKVPIQTIQNYKLLSESQDKRIKALEDQSTVDHQNHLESIKAIADLQGQIKVYKELPLQEMAQAMQRISVVNEGIAASNKQILRRLESSAVTLAKNTEDVAHAVKDVKTDLAHQ